ncbi:succinylglutamate desuccinylase [Aquabacterium sp. A7-Y]|uniref:succinylglutamate desuccinylase n=1 Tax=Aquabacterium sp. A7-Y TaxID=1349605 RepID=UPI00223E7371|nr:succinylglutamate desuccinylase [Aquabacterium sp. A7-Y]MCW7539753.1 succinylglutamate desuccinylase [Aquabacterium sp. A7-Y]
MALLDFAGAAAGFSAAGWQCEEWAPEVWRYAPRPGNAPWRLLLSVGVHGDETAPIEMLQHLLARWARAAGELRCELLLCVGNPAAVAAGRRYLEQDMNRLFSAQADRRGGEGARAALLRGVSARFLQGGVGPAIHLDLHTTIRPSLRPTFAVLPENGPEAVRQALLAWLASAGLDAALSNPLPSSTFSAWSAGLGAAACTIELGQVGRIGGNRMELLERFTAALGTLVRRPIPGPAGGGELACYRVTRELLRTSEAFRLLLPPEATQLPLLFGRRSHCRGRQGRGARADGRRVHRLSQSQGGTGPARRTAGGAGRQRDGVSWSAGPAPAAGRQE